MPSAPVALTPFSYIFRLLLVYTVPVSASKGLHMKRSGSVDAPSSLNRSLLAIQLGSIAGAYVVFVAVLLALLLFVGRRLRRTVHSSNYSLQMQILRPVKPTLDMDPSPITPMSQNIPSLHRGGRPSQTSFNGSMVTVDESVVASDRQRAQDEMEMLYAAVLEHDAQKSAGVDIDITARNSDSQSNSPASQYSNPFTDRHTSQNSGFSSSALLNAPLKSPKPSRLSKLFSSNARSNPDAGKLKSPRLSIRKQQISSPIGSPGPLGSPEIRSPQPYIPEQPPLSPRIYNPGPPPSIPSTRPGLGFGQNTPSIMPPTGRSRAPAPLNLSTTNQAASNLPFRDAYPLRSAPATKTTILERPVKNSHGPITGVPTPYSAYMPFTPVTPFTPGRTVTKRQRRREEKENGLRVLNEDDLVKDDDDVWG
ncbi:hypothetical protein N7523_003637 [Penicillium sp. IBT 18751x]|nr:hypothetical protein N7523_003637 [Penicillium sp. IBT 18751x]